MVLKMKRKIWSIPIAATAVLLACCIVSAKAQSLFKKPELVLSAAEGTNPGELGLRVPQPEGEISFPSDFAVDAKGNFWILDDVNRRIQKFNTNGDFVLAWDGDGRSILSGAILEADNEGNIYVMVSDTERHWWIAKLNTEAQIVRHFLVSDPPISDFYLRVNSKGAMCINSGFRARFLDKEGNTVLSRGSVYRIFTSAFSEKISLRTLSEGGDILTLERYVQIPEKGIPGLSVSLKAL